MCSTQNSDYCQQYLPVKKLVPPTLTRLTVKRSNLKQNLATNVPESSLEEAKNV